MGCFVSKKRYHADRDELQAVYEELQAVREDFQALKDEQALQADGFRRARAQAIHEELQAVRGELQALKDEQTLQADGFRRARAQVIRDRNHLFEVKCDNAIMQKQLFSTSMELVELAKGANAPVCFSSLSLKTGLAFKATLL